MIVFCIFVVLELFSKVFKDYPGLRSLSRWVLGLAGAIAPLGFVLNLFAPGASVFSSKTLIRLVGFERGVDSGLVIFIAPILFFISRYPIRLPKNTLVHRAIYCIWFLGDAAVLLSASFPPRGAAYHLNNILAILQIACYLGWAVLLSKDGESRAARVFRHISLEQERSLLKQLGSLTHCCCARDARSLLQTPLTWTSSRICHNRKA